MNKLLFKTGFIVLFCVCVCFFFFLRLDLEWLEL